MKTRKPKTAPKLKQPYISPVNGLTVNLTDSQKQFTDAALQTKDSDVLIRRVMEIYECKKSVARVIARQNFSKPNILEYLGDRGYRAIDVLNQAMNAKNAKWNDRISAAKDLADRQFGKPITTNVNANLNVNLEQALNDLL